MQYFFYKYYWKSTIHLIYTDDKIYFIQTQLDRFSY